MSIVSNNKDQKETDFFSEKEISCICQILENCRNKLNISQCLNKNNHVADFKPRAWNFILNSLLIISEELKTRGTFHLLNEIVVREYKNCNEIYLLQKEIQKCEEEFKKLQNIRKEDEIKLKIELQNKNRIITEQTDELEKLKDKNDNELAFTKEWLKTQIEEHELKHALEVKELKQQIDEINLSIEEEGKVHTEITWYYETEEKRLNELISRWDQRSEDIEKRKNELTVLTNKQKEQHEELEYFKSLYASRNQELEEYLADKERRRKEHEALLYLQKMGIKIQAWWRGIMVRRCLGSFRHLIKLRNAKKTRMSLKRPNKK